MSHIRRAGLLQIEHWEMQTRSGSGRTGLGSQLPQPSELVPGGFATHIVRLGEPLHRQPSTWAPFRDWMPRKALNGMTPSEKLAEVLGPPLQVSVVSIGLDESELLFG